MVKRSNIFPDKQMLDQQCLIVWPGPSFYTVVLRLLTLWSIKKHFHFILHLSTCLLQTVFVSMFISCSIQSISIWYSNASSFHLHSSAISFQAVFKSTYISCSIRQHCPLDSIQKHVHFIPYSSGPSGWKRIENLCNILTSLHNLLEGQTTH